MLDDEGIDHPDAWDERVVDLAAFVERGRGLTFEHPVAVDFLTEDEYSEAARVDEGSLTDDERDAMTEGETVLEALGLVPAGTDLVDTTNDLTDAGTLAFYDPTPRSTSTSPRRPRTPAPSARSTCSGPPCCPGSGRAAQAPPAPGPRSSRARRNAIVRSQARVAAASS